MFPFAPLPPEALRLMFPMSSIARAVRWHTSLVQSVIYHSTWLLRK